MLENEPSLYQKPNLKSETRHSWKWSSVRLEKTDNMPVLKPARDQMPLVESFLPVRP